MEAFPSLYLVGKRQSPAEEQRKLKPRGCRSLLGCHPGTWRVGSLSGFSWGTHHDESQCGDLALGQVCWRRENLVEARKQRLWFLLECGHSHRKLGVSMELKSTWPLRLDGAQCLRGSRVAGLQEAVAAPWVEVPRGGRGHHDGAVPSLDPPGTS